MSNRDSHDWNIFKTEQKFEEEKKTYFLLYFTGDWLEKVGFAFGNTLTICSMNLLQPKYRYATVTLNQYSLGQGCNSLGIRYDINNFEVSATALVWNRHLWVWRWQNVNYWLYGMIVVAFWEGSAAMTVRIEDTNHLQIAVYYTTPTDSLWEPPNQSPLKMMMWQVNNTKQKHLSFIAVRDCGVECVRQPSAKVPSNWLFWVVRK
jgi:hypothetical protein